MTRTFENRVANEKDLYLKDHINRWAANGTCHMTDATLYG